VRIAVLGATGFIGSSVVSAGRAQGLDISGAPTIRITDIAGADVVSASAAWMQANPGDFRRQIESLQGFDVVVNAAGAAAPAARDHGLLFAANAVQPAIAALAAFEAGVRRFVHISSAAVQGRLDPLDETSRHLPLSPYARSKVAGEQALSNAAQRTGAGPAEMVVYRPPSVYGPGRPATHALARLVARLPAFPIGGRGDQPVPLALIGNVAAGIVHAATMAHPAEVILQPWEGLTSRSLLELFGARRFVPIPERLVRAGLRLAGNVHAPELASRLRWLELTLAGQGIHAEALAASGFVLPLGRDAWARMVEQELLRGDLRAAVPAPIPDSGLR